MNHISKLSIKSILEASGNVKACITLITKNGVYASLEMHDGISYALTMTKKEIEAKRPMHNNTMWKNQDTYPAVAKLFVLKKLMETDQVRPYLTPSN